MPNILDSIQVSGSSYDIKDKNAPSVSAVTQQEYDNLPSSAKTSNTFFVITDAQAGDLTQYWTSAQTQSAITQATSGKVDSNVYTAYTASTDTAIQGKQDTLVSGTNIKTINNESLLGSGNITIQGGGGGSYTAGTNISIADNIINCTLPISAGTNSSDKGIIIGDSECSATGKYGVAIGHNSDANGDYSFCDGSNSNANGSKSFAWGDNCDANGDRSWAVGYNAKTASNKTDQFLHGRNISSSNSLETVFGTYNNTSISSSTFGNSGNTLFAIGNGYDFSSTHNHHNAIEIRQNGDIYIPNTNDTSITGDLAYSLYPMIKLQDHLGGGGGKAIEAGRGISVTTGETADTVSFDLPISAGSQSNSVVVNYNGNRASGWMSFAQGRYTLANNQTESAFGNYNISSNSSNSFGNSGNTLFTVGNGEGSTTTHNSFEIRQNGDIYIADTNDTSTTNYWEKPMIKLQDKFSSLDSTIGDINTILESI